MYSHDGVSRVTIADELMDHCCPSDAVVTTIKDAGNCATAADDEMYDKVVVTTLYTLYAALIVSTNESAVNLDCNTVVVSVVGRRRDTICALSIDLDCMCVTAEEDLSNAEASSCCTVVCSIDTVD